MMQNSSYLVEPFNRLVGKKWMSLKYGAEGTCLKYLQEIIVFFDHILHTKKYKKDGQIKCIMPRTDTTRVVAMRVRSRMTQDNILGSLFFLQNDSIEVALNGERQKEKLGNFKERLVGTIFGSIEIILKFGNINWSLI